MTALFILIIVIWCAAAAAAADLANKRPEPKQPDPPLSIVMMRMGKRK
jgi:hypothetical protein